ncbi:MAG TPA: DUF2809 domain-containing protein [Sphingobacteriaceae bacterium]|nr:DUF2809 domain-containing protein [Sphingobacteriaceae bacterium]
MLTFKLNYFVLTLVLFITEVIIALLAHDDIIRPYIGDLLVVILLYCFVKSFLNLPVKTTAISVLFFSYLIEILQYFTIVKHLGLGSSNIANLIIGNYFTWVDILAYTLGILMVFGIEKLRQTGLNRRLHQLNHTHVWLFL